MTLHEAIIKVLQQEGRTMTTREIADALNRNKWYIKEDKSPIATSQISARIAEYPELFSKNGSLISIRGEHQAIIRNKIHAAKAMRTLDQANMKNELPMALGLKILMNEKNFKTAGTIDQKVPDEPGLYCIRIADPSALPPPFNSLLTARGHNILYIGIATASLYHRFLGQELRARGHGTFFRGIGAVLGFRPPKGSLRSKANKNNYTFSAADQKAIIAWINKHLLVNWVAFGGDFEDTETQLIQQYLPLLNTAKNPAALEELGELRKVCRNIANN